MDIELLFSRQPFVGQQGDQFAFTSLNTNELDEVERHLIQIIIGPQQNVEDFALLVLSDEYGAVIKEANPPKR